MFLGAVLVDLWLIYDINEYTSMLIAHAKWLRLFDWIEGTTLFDPVQDTAANTYCYIFFLSYYLYICFFL